MGSDAEVMLVVQTQHQQTGRSVVANGVEYSLRRWSCTLLEGRPRASNATQLPYIKKVEFILHETFKNPHRVVHHPPFRVEEEGWGEFDLVSIIHFVNCPEPLRITHDLNFHVGEHYESKYPLIVPNPSAAFLTLFNKHTTVSRKTIPARATKARKGPPRDSHYSTSQRTSNGSAGSSSGFSDLDSDSQLSSSDDESDSHSFGNKRRSASSASAASSGRVRTQARPRDEMRPNAASKHAGEKATRPKSATARAVAGDNPMSSPLSAADDHRSHLPGQTSVVRQKKNAALQGVRRVAADMTAPAKLRRSPNDEIIRNSAAAPAQTTARAAANGLMPRGTAKSPIRTQAAAAQARMADRKLPAVPARNSSSVSPPTNRLDRAVAPGSSGIRRPQPQDQQRRRRASDALEAAAKGGARRRTAGPGEITHAPTKTSPPINPVRSEVTAIKRPPVLGISGVKVPKKRTIKTAIDDLGDTGRRIKGEKRDALGRDDTMAAPAKRPRTAGAGAMHRDDRRLSSMSPASMSTSSSISPPPPRARALQNTAATSTAASSRAAFVREREKQRYLDSAGKPASAVSRTQKSPVALGLLGKSARNNIATARARTVAEEPVEPVAEPPRRKTVKRDLSDISIPKIPHKSTPASGMAVAVDAAPALNGTEEVQTRAAAVPTRVKRTISAGKSHGGLDDGMATGLALSPELLRKMERIMEKASSLNEHSMVGFLSLLHSLRVEQEPESAGAITEEAAELVESSGMYSCNLSMLAPEAIDRLWVFMREIRV
ncbi:transcription factor TFIIF complex subunit Tfg3 [Coemansia sp. RSA 2526]|nr:transcription factor TFIIF complex subunit Tfg3 [Coemansia sp. RSA 2526]